MTTEELREIDKRVAVEMGWRVVEKETPRFARNKYKVVDSEGNLQYSAPNEEACWSWGCPYFTTDARAADLVRLEIECRGWSLVRLDYLSKRPLPAYPSQHRAQVSVECDKGDCQYWGTSDDSPHVALCLAFLAACEANKKEVGEEASK